MAINAAHPHLFRAAAGLTGPLTVVLFGCGLLFGDLLGTSNFPPIDASAGVLRRYVAENPLEVRGLSFFHQLAALALLTFAVVLSTRLHRAAPSCWGRALVVAAAGTLAAAFLLLSALSYRVLALPSIAGDPDVGRAILVLSYLAGGPALAAPLGLLEIAAASLALRGVLLPRWLGWLGIVAGAISLLSTLYLFSSLDNRSWLYAVLLLGAVLSLAWIFLAGIVLALPPRRPAAAPAT